MTIPARDVPPYFVSSATMVGLGTPGRSLGSFKCMKKSRSCAPLMPEKEVDRLGSFSNHLIQSLLVLHHGIERNPLRRFV